MANALVKKTGIYAVGNFASKITTALIIPIYAWFVAVEALGYYDYFLTLMTMLAPLCYMALWEAVLRFTIAETDTERLDRAVSTVFAMVAGSTLFIIIVSIVLCTIFPDMRLFVIYVALMITVYGLAQVWQFFARSFKQSKLYAASGITAALLNFASILILVCAIGMQLEGLVISYVISQASIVILIECKLRVIIRFDLSRVDRRLMKRYLAFSCPMAVNLLLGALLAGFGRILVVNHLGADANGLYAFAMKFGALVTAVGGIFSMAVIEEAVLRIGKPGHEDFMEKVANSSMFLLLSLAIVALPLVKILWPVLAGEEYASSLAMVPAFLAYGVLTVEATVTGNVFNIVNKTHFNALSMLVGCIVAATFSLALIGPFSTTAVAWSTAAGALSLLAMRYLIGRKYVPYRLHLGQATILCAVFALETWMLSLDWGDNWLLGCLIWSTVAIAFFAPMALKGIKGISSIKDID